MIQTAHIFRPIKLVLQVRFLLLVSLHVD